MTIAGRQFLVVVVALSTFLCMAPITIHVLASTELTHQKATEAEGGISGGGMSSNLGRSENADRSDGEDGDDDDDDSSQCGLYMAMSSTSTPQEPKWCVDLIIAVNGKLQPNFSMKTMLC